jgi:UDP-N-acetyl-D-galactosamine dehydrogenase
VIDLVKSLKEFGVSVSVFDPLVNREDVVNEYKLEVLAEILPIKYDAVILAVNHQEFMNLCWEDYLKTPHVFADVKSALPNSISDFRL